MAQRLQLEDFGAPRRPHIVSGGGGLSEEQRLAAFEQGYRDGWDDAVAAQNDQESKISTEFANNLRDLAFTFHEARVHVLNGVEPVIRDLVTKLLPKIGHEALPDLVWEHLSELMTSTAERPFQITVSPASRPALDRVLPTDPGFPLKIVEEPSLAEGQVYLAAGPRELCVDIDGVLQGIAEMVDDHFSEPERKQAYG